MLDWHVQQDKESLSGWRDEPPTPWPPPRGGRWIAAGTLLLLIALGLLLRARLTDQSLAMESDLADFVRYEEQQRRFGLTEQSNRLVISNAPARWKEAYRRAFPDPEDARPLNVTLGEVVWEQKTRALVMVQLDGQPQLRAYQLANGGWRRTYLRPDDWGESRTLQLADDLTLHYQDRDADLVRQLAGDLPSLLKQWPRTPAVRTITIRPREFGDALVRRDEGEVVLNSPLLLAPERLGNGAWSPVDYTRFVLADALLLDETAEMEDTLPNADRFHATARATIAVRWALDAAALDRLRARWVERLDGRWKSPLLAEWPATSPTLAPGRLWRPPPSLAGALLVTDYLYDQLTPAGLADAARNGLRSAPGWDALFTRLLDRYTVDIEAAVRAAIHGGALDEPRAAHALPPVPFEARVVEIDPLSGHVRLDVAGRAVQLDATRATLTGPAGEPLATGCAGLFAHLTVEAGDWLDLDGSFQATTVALRDWEASLPTAALDAAISPLPPDTLALLVRYAPEATNGPYFFFERIIALQEDGQSSALVTPPEPLVLVQNWAPAAFDETRLLFARRLRDCTQAWLYLYDPLQGIVGYWLTDPDWRFGDNTQMFYRPDRGDALLFNLPAARFVGGVTQVDHWQYGILDPDGPLVARVLGEFPDAMYPQGWLAESNQIIAMDWTDGLPVLRFIDAESATQTKEIMVSDAAISFFVMSRNGRWLFYADGWGVRDLDAQVELKMLDLVSGEERTLMTAERGEALWPAWGQTLADQVLIFAGSVEARFDVRRILRIDPTRPDEPQTLVELADDEAFRGALVCSDERLLVWVQQGGTHQLRLWEPGGTRVVATDPLASEVLACR